MYILSLSIARAKHLYYFHTYLGSAHTCLLCLHSKVLFHGYNAKLEAPPCYGCTDSKVCSFTGCQSIQSVNTKLHPSHRMLMLSSNIKTNDQLMTTRLWGQCLSQLSIYMSTSQSPLDVDKLIVELEEAQ